MKRILVLLVLFIFILSSCSEKPDITLMLEEFVDSYGASGIVYSTDFSEGQVGYIDSELSAKLFGNEVDGIQYAVFLNTHLDYISECGVFWAECSKHKDIIEICQRRMSLLDLDGEDSFIRIYGNIIFYSTMQDREKAEYFADLIFKN